MVDIGKAISNIWDDITGKKVENLAYVRIAQDHIEDDPHPDWADIVANRDYVRVQLSEMRLDFDLAWFTEWHPMVHALTTATFGDQTIDLPYVAGERNLPEVNEDHQSRSRQIGSSITPLIPFKGGTIKIKAALLSVKGENYLASFIGVVGDFASLLPGNPIATALPVVTPIITGVQTLLGGRDKETQAYLEEDFFDPIQPGYIALVRQPEGQRTPELWVMNQRLFGGPRDAREEFDGTFMLLRLARVGTRDDWNGFKAINDNLNEALRLMWMKKDTDAEQSLVAAKSLVATSPDFTQVDSLTIVQKIESHYEEMKKLRDSATEEHVQLMSAKVVTLADLMKE